MSWSAAARGCLLSVLHCGDLHVALSGSAWEFLLFSYHPLKGFSAHHCVQNRPKGLKNVSDTILWHVPLIKLELQLWLFFPVCSLHHLLLLLADFIISILSAYLICRFPLSQGCLCAFLHVCCTASHMCSVLLFWLLSHLQLIEIHLCHHACSVLVEQ